MGLLPLTSAVSGFHSWSLLLLLMMLVKNLIRKVVGFHTRYLTCVSGTDLVSLLLQCWGKGWGQAALFPSLEKRRDVWWIWCADHQAALSSSAQHFQTFRVCVFYINSIRSLLDWRVPRLFLGISLSWILGADLCLSRWCCRWFVLGECVLFVGGLWQQQSCASETINIKHPRLLVCRRMFSALLPHLLLWSSWENGLYLGDELGASSAGHS